MLAGTLGVRLGWLLLGALALTAYARIVLPGERAVQSIGFHAQELYDLTNRNERMIAGAASLQSARDRVTEDLARLSSHNSAGRVTQATLRLLQKEAQHHRLILLGLSPADSGNAAGSSPAQDVTIALRGAYPDLVAVAADLPRHDVLVEITAASFSGNAPGLGVPASVDATLSATLYYGLPVPVSAAKESDRDAPAAR